MKILALNAGSSTLKYQLIDMPPGDVLARGVLDHAGDESIVSAAEKALDDARRHDIDAIAHRIVHGGDRFHEPTVVTPEVVDVLRGLASLDPMHNPTQVRVIEAARRLAPNIPSVAVFDTAFHRTIPDVAAVYGLPWDLTERLKIRRYGFHGLSFKYVSEKLLQLIARDAVDASRLIVCHLGNGAGVCAIKNGKSVDTSMGFTPLAGLLMGTRSGDIDPGVLIYLQRGGGMTAGEVDRILNEESGLKGVSGKSADVRDLEAAASAGDPRSELALSIFAYRVRQYIGAYAASMGGVDAVAFTGGIGEHSSSMRARICDGLEFMGFVLDQSANGLGEDARKISVADAGVDVWVVPTNEEWELAKQASALFQA